MSIVRFGMIGCGRISLKHISALKACGDAKVVIVCDLVEERAKAVAAEFGCDWCTDYKAVLARPDVDIVDICTPNDTHPAITLEAARGGKHVLTEKPMALTIEDCDRMIEVCRECNVRLFVVKQNRFNPPILKMRQALERGRFGKLFMANVTVRWSRPQDYYEGWHGTKDRDGGMLFTQASHHIDMIQWMMGPVHSVKANVATLTHDIETDDNAVIALKFKSGALGIIESSTSIFPRNLEGSITLMGSRGTAKVGGTALNKVEHWEFADFENEDDNVLACATNPSNVYGYGHVEVIRSVVDSLNGKKPAWEVDGIEGRKSVRLILAMYESAATGREIFLD